MEWLMTGGSLHLERSTHPDFDMGIWGGGGVRLSFRYIQYMVVDALGACSGLLT